MPSCEVVIKKPSLHASIIVPAPADLQLISSSTNYNEASRISLRARADYLLVVFRPSRLVRAQRNAPGVSGSPATTRKPPMKPSPGPTARDSLDCAGLFTGGASRLTERHGSAGLA